MRKKITALLFAVAILVSSLQATVPGTAPVSEPLYPIGHGVKISFEQLKTLTPKEYKKLTGHKLGLFKSIALKSVQKKLHKQGYYAGGDKSQVTALLLCVFLGGLGIHRFYLGYTWQGIVQLLTLGGLGIWALIDLVRIITGDLKPKNGEYAKTL